MTEANPRLRRRALAGGLAAAAILGRGAAAQTVLRWGDSQPAAHPAAQMIERAAATIRERSAGRIQVQGFPGGQLGSTRDMIEATSSGAQTMVTEGAASLGQFVPAYSVVEAPYLWRDAAHMARALAAPVMEDLNRQLVERRQLRVIANTYYGMRHLTTKDRAVRGAEDMRGFRLRVPEVDTFRAMAEAWGARATPINFNELYLALSQGAVDGQENPLPTIQGAKLFEVQRFLVLTGHIITPRMVVMNERAWNALAVADRALVATAVREAAAWQDAELARSEAGAIDTLKTAGMTVIEPDVESFRRPVLASVPARFESRWGRGMFERLAAM
jgi:tripartite ATP-independent transporter DctP family solute receptor